MNTSVQTNCDRVDLTSNSKSDETNSPKMPNTFMNNFINPCISAFGATFGLSCLILSSVIAKAGIIAWVLTLVVSLFINYVSFIIILKISKKHKFESFIQFADLFSNSVLRNGMKAIYFFLNFGILLTSCLVFNSLLAQIFRQLGYENKLFTNDKSIGFAIALHFLSLPLLLKRKISEFSIITLFSLCSCFYIVGFLVFTAITKGPTVQHALSNTLYFNISEIPKCYFVNFFIFSMQINLFSIYNELPNPSMAAIKPIILTNFVFLTIIYTLIGISGYFIFIDSQKSLIQQEIILHMFNNSDKSVLIASFLMILTSMNTFFYSFKPTKDIILKVMFMENEDQTRAGLPINVENETQEKIQNSVNLPVTFVLMLLSLAASTMIIVFQISFMVIIDFMADVFMPCLFVFVPLLLYSREKLKISVLVVLTISCLFYIAHFSVQLFKSELETI